MLTKIRESAHKALLDSDKVPADVRDHLGPWIDMIREVTDYGSNLIPRCFDSSKKEFEGYSNPSNSLAAGCSDVRRYRNPPFTGSAACSTVTDESAF